MNVIRIFILLTLLFFFSCSSPNSTENFLAVDKDSVKLGIKENGNFTARENKVFFPIEKVVIRAKFSGLQIKGAKIKVNADIALNKDDKELEKKEKIFGSEGKVITVPGVASDFSSNQGEAFVNFEVNVSGRESGSYETEITLIDLNTEDRTISFKIQFELK